MKKKYLKKYTLEWKLKNKIWYQKHANMVYRHYIQFDTEYSVPTGYSSIREAELLDSISDFKSCWGF